MKFYDQVCRAMGNCGYCSGEIYITRNNQTVCQNCKRRNTTLL